MRAWDVEPKKLCNRHLLGEHRELHAIWSILTNNKKGYRQHPETQRWIGKEKALFRRHEKLIKEMTRRSFRHDSLLDKKLAVGRGKQTDFVNTIKEQDVILKEKNCDCPLSD